MATFTRKFLATLGIEDDKVDAIMEKHSEVVGEIKAERDELREKAEQLPDLQKQLEGYKEAEKNGAKDPYRVKYEALKEDFEAYKKEIADKETTAKKEGVYRQLLKDAGVSEKRIDAILKVTDLNSLELDNEGKAIGADKIAESIKAEWSDFIQTTGEQGASVANPPTNQTKAVKTKKEIMEIKDTAERQNAWKEYISANQKGQ